VSEPVLPRIAAGDPTAVDDCLSRYRALVWSIVRRYGQGYADAEDAVQDIFIELWRTAGRFDPQIAAESTYVTTIARRRLIDRHRKRTRRIDAIPMGDQPLPAPAESDGQMELADDVSRIRIMMEQLRPVERDVLELTYTQGLTQSQIAEQTGMPLGSVKTHSRRGIARLRQLLGVEAGPTDAGE
jgi:RNA polymerase sigma factor (sigma-70 family)